MFRHLIAVRILCHLLGIILAQCCLAAKEPGSANYPNPVIHLNVSVLGHFDAVLPELAKQGRVAIVCEGQPLHLDLTADQTQQLERRINPNGMALNDTVKWVAAAYDYEMQRTGANTFVLTKRYTDPDDLPDIPFDETATAFQNIMTAMQNFYPRMDEGTAIYNIMSTVSDAQRTQLATGVAVAELDNDQKKDARCLVNQTAFHSMIGIARVSERLQACRSTSSYFTEEQKYGVTFPIYNAPSGQDGGMRETALDAWISTQTTGSGSWFSGYSAAKLVDNTLVSTQPGLIEPTTPRPLSLIPTPIASKLCLTVAQSAKLLTARLADAHVLLAVQTAPVLAPKTLCLTGLQYESPANLVKAISIVYGLEVQTKPGLETLIQPQPTVVTDPKDILPELKHLLPAPYLRAVSELGNEDGFAPFTAPALLSMEGGLTAQANTSDFYWPHASSLYSHSVRRLREIIEPEIDMRADHKLPISETGTEAHDMLGLSNLAISLANFYDVSKPVIGYVANFDDATLMLNQNPNDTQFISYMVDAKDKDGKGGGARVVGQVGWLKFRDLAR